MDDSAVREDRLAEIEARLARLERHAGLRAFHREPAVAVPPPKPTPVAPASVAALPGSGEPLVEESAGPARGPVRDLEQVIGQRWAAWTGAVVFIIGVGLLLSLAWSRGWIGVVPPSLRCVGAAIFGGALLVAAQAVRRRFGDLAATGLSAAGLGVIDMAVYAAYAFFGLIPAAVAMLLLAGVAVLGTLIAARNRFPAVGVLALLGGYIAPLLLSTPDPSPWVMPVHLTGLLTLALGVTTVRGESFRMVRATGLVGTLSLGALWTWSLGAPVWAPPLAFAAAVWSLTAAHVSWTAGRDTSPVTGRGARGPLVALASTTAWALAVVFLATPAAELGVEWAPTLGLSVASGVLLLRRRTDWRAVLGRPATVSGAVGTFHAWQSLVLLAAVVGLGLAGWVRLAVWMLMAVGAAVVAERARVRPLLVYAALVLGAASARLILLDSWDDAELEAWTAVAGLHLTRWMAVAGLLAGAWLAVANRGGLAAGPGRPPRLARACAAAGVALAFGLWVHPRTDAGALLYVWPVVGALVLWARPLWPRLGAGYAAFGGLSLSVAAWVAIELGRGWDRPATPILLHPGLGSAVLLAAALRFGAWRAAETPRGAAVVDAVSWVLVGVLMFLASSAEVARAAARFFQDDTARASVLSVWWAVLAAGLITAGFALRLPWPRRTGLALFGLSLAKVVLFDLVELSLEWRTVSFLALGAALLGVGLLYARASRGLGVGAGGPTASPRS